MRVCDGENGDYCFSRKRLKEMVCIGTTGFALVFVASLVGYVCRAYHLTGLMYLAYVLRTDRNSLHY
jgi:hypothetical protein